MKQKLQCLTLLLFCCFAAHSQIDVTLYEQFNGKYDFTFVGNTLNTIGNNGTTTPCEILTSSSATLNLDPDETLIKAYMYWAGSGTGDFNVTLNGNAIAAERTFNVQASNTDGNTRPYFSAFADVTSILQTTGNGTYTLADLDLTDLINDDVPNEENLYCQIATNFGGWAIIVVYEKPSLPLNQLNLYDGLQFVPSFINITLPSLNVVDNLGAKIGFLAWEGDAVIQVNESLTINGSVLSNTLNPANNAFNGTNTETGSNQLYNMDVDVYDIQNFIQVGDDTAEIQLTSGQDFVMINAIMTKLNSQLPDATIVLDEITKICSQNLVTVDYTVYNVNSTDVLPAHTPIAIYLNGDLIGTTETVNEIAIGGNEPGTITLTMPAGITGDAQLLFVVDDTGNGTGTVIETNENNNNALENITLWQLPELEPADITICETTNGSNVGLFDFSDYEQTLANNPGDVVTFHTSLVDAQSGDNDIQTPESFLSTSNPQEIFVRLWDENGCLGIGSFLLIAKDCNFPDGVVAASNLIQACDSRQITVTYTVSNPNSFDILPNNTPVAIYANTTLLTVVPTASDIAINGSLNNTVSLTIPNNIPLSFNLMFVVDDNGTGTGIIEETNETNNSFTLPVTLWVSPILQQPADVTACETFNGSGIGVFDFSGYLQSLKVNDTDIITFHETQADVDSGTNDITEPNAYSSATAHQIFVRLEDENGCYDTAIFTLVIIDCFFPDATVVVEEVYKQCNSRIIHVHYTVSNFNGTDVLPAATPLSIYVNGQFLDYTETLEDIAIGESESNYITLTIPIGIPLDFNLTFVADDTGDGTGIVIELDETNNANTLPTSLVLSPEIAQPADIEGCDAGFGLGKFDFSSYAESLKNYPNETVTFYETQQNADQALNQIYNTTSYAITTNPQRIYVRLDNGTCHTTASFLLYTKKCAPTPYNYVTPNGDGINDGFFVDGLRNIFLNFKMSIYNRWGTLIWTGDHSKADWNGIADVEKVGSEGTTVPAGTYYFVLELNDADYPQPIVGWVYVTK
ncbi:T9SS type B sorting domain-containing protein [Flavobacterium zepuense]|uniref:T9SS type B sorting domain-containing protein n=1 Tax=Flavobacterium zepuense TaxID=2593302 RepID=A0A552UXP8_9FLAO|nr:gliding motility-associated C-terminal domain-containing protein [Flavobacterium zepuense]TRW22985.1 T9SS type B sorting domain-containing protein [Flavobacterium zepuense]